VIIPMISESPFRYESVSFFDRLIAGEPCSNRAAVGVPCERSHVNVEL
jgi:hypothetical protein